jgi:hypothetical protein
VELGAQWNLPVTAEQVKEHLASHDEGTRQWLVKARGGL